MIETSETRAPTISSRVERIWREVGPKRLIATGLLLIVAVIVARTSWDVPLISELERVLYDVRASVAMDRVEQDERIAILFYDENTLVETQVRSPLDREIFAQALINLNDLNVRGIAVDIAIDQSTPNDEILIEALQQMRVPTFLGFLSSKYNPLEIQPVQEDFMAEFIQRVGTDEVQHASVLLNPDADNVLRVWPRQPRDIPPLFANALAPGHDAYRDYAGSIAYRVPLYEDGAVFLKLPIDFLADPMLAAEFGQQLEGRYIFIGTELQGIDQFETPLSRMTDGDTMAGVEAHATLLAQILDGTMTRTISGWALWLIAGCVVIAGALTALSDMRLWKLALLLIVQIAVILAFPFIFHLWGTDTINLPALGWIAGWGIAFFAVGAAARSVGAEKRHFVTGALGKYLPGDVANQLLENPESLSLHGEKRQIYALFTDLEGFTKLSHAIEPEMVATLLNRYLDMLSETVLEHGGTLDKYVGDAVVAFWGAPISRPDDAERAAKCAIAMWEAGEEFRKTVPEGVPPIGRTRVGLHYGEAIVGNFGGEDRIQYTALGDAMNTAARLEGANKYLDTSVIASREAIETLETPVFRPLGRVTLSGRSTPVEIYEPVFDITAGSSEMLHICYQRFETGDAQAIDDLIALAGDNPDDAALENLINRLRETQPGGSYVFKDK